MLSDDQKMRRLPWALGMISSNSIFAYTVFAGPVLVLFLAELGLSKTQVGFVLASFPLTGMVAIVIGPAVAHLGYKRSFLLFWAGRKTLAASLLLTPLLLARTGPSGAGIYAMVVFALFALSRSIADTAYYPWTQDFVPDRIRGRFTALDNLLWTGLGFVTLGFVSVTLSRYPGLEGFMRCLAVGIPFGYLSVFCTTFMPGGGPVTTQTSLWPNLHALRSTLHDANFARFLFGLGLISLALIPVTGFLPLFAREAIGLAQGNVVLMQNATLLGGLLSSYVWGWTADRIGSKPVMLVGAVSASVTPLLWLMLPRQSAWSLPLAVALALVAGLAGSAWAIGSARILFIELMPAGKQALYTAVYYSWAGLTGAMGALISGRMLDYAQQLRSVEQGLDGYLIVFGASALLAATSLIILPRIAVGRRP